MSRVASRAVLSQRSAQWCRRCPSSKGNRQAFPVRRRGLGFTRYDEMDPGSEEEISGATRAAMSMKAASRSTCEGLLLYMPTALELTADQHLPSNVSRHHTASRAAHTNGRPGRCGSGKHNIEHGWSHVQHLRLAVILSANHSSTTA